MTERTPEERRALDDLFNKLYGRLHELARRVGWRSINPTLGPTALVHEVYLRVLNSSTIPEAKDYEELVSAFANVMRQILIDAARRKSAQKRVPVEAPKAHQLPIEHAVAIATLVDALRVEHPRQAQVVDCHFYLGMSFSETASILGVSLRTVSRDWEDAKQYLQRGLEQRKSP